MRVSTANTARPIQQPLPRANARISTPPKVTDRPETPPPPPPDPLLSFVDGIGSAMKSAFNGIGKAIGGVLTGIFGGGQQPKNDAATDGEVVRVNNANDRTGKPPVLFVNGAGTARDGAIDNAKTVGEVIGGRNVELIRNATDIPQYDGNLAAQGGAFLANMERDVAQVRSDYRGGPNPAADSLRDKILERLRGDSDPIEIVGVSQGTIISRNGIERALDARRTELEATMSSSEVEAQLTRDMDRIHFANVAGAVARSDFPRGLTHYTEVHHPADPVVNLLGAGRGNISAEEWDRRASTIAADLLSPIGTTHGAVLIDRGLQDRLRNFFG